MLVPYWYDSPRRWDRRRIDQVCWEAAAPMVMVAVAVVAVLAMEAMARARALRAAVQTEGHKKAVRLSRLEDTIARARRYVLRY